MTKVDIGAQMDARRAQERRIDTVIALVQSAQAELLEAIMALEQAGCTKAHAEFSDADMSLTSALYRLKVSANCWLREAPAYTGGWPGAYLPGDR